MARSQKRNAIPRRDQRPLLITGTPPPQHLPSRHSDSVSGLAGARSDSPAICWRRSCHIHLHRMCSQPRSAARDFPKCNTYTPKGLSALRPRTPPGSGIPRPSGSRSRPQIPPVSASGPPICEYNSHGGSRSLYPRKGERPKCRVARSADLRQLPVLGPSSSKSVPFQMGRDSWAL